MTADEKATVLQASKILADEQKARFLGSAKELIDKRKERERVQTLESAKLILAERKGDKDAEATVQALDSQLRLIAEKNKPAAKASVQGAQIPSAELNLGKPAQTSTKPVNALRTAFDAEMLPHLKQRFGAK